MRLPARGGNPPQNLQGCLMQINRHFFYTWNSICFRGKNPSNTNFKCPYHNPCWKINPSYFPLSKKRLGIEKKSNANGSLGRGGAQTMKIMQNPCAKKAVQKVLCERVVSLGQGGIRWDMMLRVLCLRLWYCSWCRWAITIHRNACQL